MSDAYERIRTLIELERWREAAEAASTALGDSPDDARLIGWLCQAELALDQPYAAAQTARRLIALAPDDEWTHRLVSISYREIGDVATSVAAAREAVRLAPWGWRTHQTLAMALAGDRRHIAEAARSADEAVRLAPNEPATHFTAGYVAQRAGRRDAARTAYRRVLELDPTNSTAQNNLGVLDGLRARRAVGLYVGALRSDPDSIVAQRNLHRLITVLTFDVYVAEVVAFVVAAILARAYDGPSVLSRILGAVFVVAAVGYVVSVCRQVPRGAWRHTTRRFGVPGMALWNLVPITLVGIWLMVCCYSSDAVETSTQAVVPLAVIAVVLVLRRRRRLTPR